MEASVVHVRWVQFLQELQRTEPPVCRLDVIGFEHVGHVYLLVGPGLLSMSPARRSLREMTAGESFLGVEKSVCVLLCRSVVFARATEDPPRFSCLLAEAGVDVADWPPGCRQDVQSAAPGGGPTTETSPLQALHFGLRG